MMSSDGGKPPPLPAATAAAEVGRTSSDAYYEKGSSEAATETALVLERLETVCDKKKSFCLVAFSSPPCSSSSLAVLTYTFITQTKPNQTKNKSHPNYTI